MPVLLKLAAGYTKGVMIKWGSIEKIVREGIYSDLKMENICFQQILFRRCHEHIRRSKEMGGYWDCFQQAGASYSTICRTVFTGRVPELEVQP